MNIDPEQAATYVIFYAIAIVGSQVGVAFLYDWLFRKRNGYKHILKAIKDNGKPCDMHAPLEGRLNRLEEEHQEDTLHETITRAVKEAFKENGKR